MKLKSHPELASPIQGGTSLKTGGWIKRVSFFSWVFWSPAMCTLIMSCAPSAFVLQEYCRAIMNPPPTEKHAPLSMHKLAFAILVNGGFISSRQYIFICWGQKYFAFTAKVILCLIAMTPNQKLFYLNHCFILQRTHLRKE